MLAIILLYWEVWRMITSLVRWRLVQRKLIVVVASVKRTPSCFLVNNIYYRMWHVSIEYKGDYAEFFKLIYMWKWLIGEEDKLNKCSKDASASMLILWTLVKRLALDVSDESFTFFISQFHSPSEKLVEIALSFRIIETLFTPYHQFRLWWLPWIRVVGRVFCKKGCDADSDSWEDCKPFLSNLWKSVMKLLMNWGVEIHLSSLCNFIKPNVSLTLHYICSWRHLLLFV